MAEKTKSEEKAIEAAVSETSYPIGEIIDASALLFDYPKEVVVVALDKAEKEKVTVSEAKKLIDDFLKQEVK